MRPTNNPFAAPELPQTPKKSRITYGDRYLFSGVSFDTRFIPSREGVDLQASFNLLESPNASPTKPRKKHSAREMDAQRGILLEKQP